MIIVGTIILGVHTLAFGTIVWIGYTLQRKKEREYSANPGMNLSKLTVIIPFRNEENRIDAILDSYAKSNSFPGEILFVDDHSDDAGADKVRSTLKEIPGAELWTMPEGRQGKKEAIRFAIENSSGTHILTQDADIEFNSEYFDRISNLHQADMYVLPAIMKPKNGRERFYEVDFLLGNAVNTGLAGLTRPIMASGANLLYARDAFEFSDNYVSHAHVASGDDTFLLRDFVRNKRDVRLISGTEMAVFTETPQSLKAFFDQRVRWLAKTGQVNDALSTVTALAQFILTLSFWAFFFTALFVHW